MSKSVIGKRLPRIDAVPKVTGEAKYTVDLKMPGMLYGKILRSPHAHALIKSIDTSAAESLPGVRCVITGKDVPQNLFAFYQWQADKTMLCTDKVRYVGDEVAAVAAVDQDTAEEAVSLIKVEYEPLPAVFSVDEAMLPDAPLVHENEGNVAWSVKRLIGDPDKAFAECDVVIEDEYFTREAAHTCFEVNNCVAYWDPSGRVTVWTVTQAPHTVRQEVARILGIPRENVRIVCSHQGGGFGARTVMDVKSPIAAVLSKKTGRHVKIVNTRSEEFASAKTRFPYKMWVKVGAMKDGRIMAREAKVIADVGAYNDKCAATINFASMMFATLYDVPNMRFESSIIYTNNEMGTAFRGFGNPQLSFASEPLLDRLATELGMDPLELRLKNPNRPQQTTCSGAEVCGCGMVECLTAAADAIGWKKKRDRKTRKGLRGVGIANMVHTGGGGRFYGYNAAEAFVKLTDEGAVTVITSALEMGQGALTVMAQIAAEELGVSLDRVRVLSNDTDLTPYDLGSWGSRATFMNGNAVLEAARNARKGIVAAASDLLGAKPEDIVIADGKVSVKGNDETHELSEIVDHSVNRMGKPISGSGQYMNMLPPGLTVPEAFTKNIPCFAWGAQAVEVEVDEETGRVKVLKVVAANETGTTINPLMAEGQIEGSIAQGLGYALGEELVRDGSGKVLNDGFLDYKIPGIEDLPEMETILVETVGTDGPFGAKGIGEPGLVPTAAAVANAIYDATGVMMRELPMTPERVLQALKDARVGT